MAGSARVPFPIAHVPRMAALSAATDLIPVIKAGDDSDFQLIPISALQGAAVTLAAGTGYYNLSFGIPDLTVLTTGALDIVTDLVLGHAFQIMSWEAFTTKASTGAGASQTLNMEIETTDVGTSPSTLVLTLAGTDTLGKRTAGAAVSGAATGTAANKFSIECAAGGTVFTAGAALIVVRVKNLDTYNGVNNVYTSLQTAKLIA